jgi:hypothetical protein
VPSMRRLVEPMAGPSSGVSFALKDSREQIRSRRGRGIAPGSTQQVEPPPA